MISRKLVSTLLAIVAAVTIHSDSFAQGVNYYTENGKTFAETRRTVQRSVMQTELQSRQRTVLREQVSTEVLPQARTVLTPVTTYRWKTRWQDMLNPFTPTQYHLVPQTAWQAHQEQVDTPVVRRQMVPQTEVVSVPITTQRYVPVEVIERTVVNSTPSGTTTGRTAVARRATIGGVTQLQNDPPRQGTDWRAAGSALRR